MRIEYVSSGHAPRLLLLFAGWGMDEKPFSAISHHAYDFAVVFDYSSEDPIEIPDRYREVVVVAWSFGVIAADRFIRRHPELPVTLRVAVNGTLHPVHDSYGIPEKIFRLTLESLSESSLLKFRRRMCGGTRAMADLLPRLPQRTLESLRDELIAIESMEASHSGWDFAWVSENDQIIPAANQIAAWEKEGVAVRRAEGSHIPDFDTLLHSIITDKPLVAERFDSAAETYEENATLQNDVAMRLSEMWRANCEGVLDKAIEVGPGTGLFTRYYTGWTSIKELELWDLAPIPGNLPGIHRQCDAETAIREIRSESVDAIMSASALQWFNSQRAFIRQCSRTLRKSGWFVFSTFGPENFREIRNAAYPSMPQLMQWLEEYGFDTIDKEEYLHTQKFASPREMLRHIKLTGVNAVGGTSEGVTSARQLISRGTDTLTYHPIIIVARRR